MMEKYEGYVGAPYNFVELNDKVYEKTEFQPHDVIETKKHTGMIEYVIEAKTPIMVDDGNGQFYRDVYGEAAIPGSSMRGLVRNNMQILSFSSVSDDIQNGKLMYRNVAAGKEKKHYNDILGNVTKQYSLPNGKRGQLSVLENVRAGYLRNEGGRYYIVPTVVDSLSKETGMMNYYVLSERKIMEEKNGKFRFLLEHVPYFLQNMNRGFKKIPDKSGRMHYQGKENQGYHPYFMKVSYEVSGVRHVSGIDAWGKLSHNGYLVSTGKMKEKKAIYVIPQMDESKDKISVPQQDIDDFKRDYEGRKNQVEAAEKSGQTGFFNLPQKGETKPVFYIQLGSKLYFGFTPRLRLFYDKEIHDGMSDTYKSVKRDYCKSVFGYTDNQDSYKSRVSFSDAVVVRKKEKNQGIQLVLASPKPTSYLDYLTSSGKSPVSYNDDFQLRGVKQYWLKQRPDQAEPSDNRKVSSTFFPYEAGTSFQGKIRFENLSDEELGMLLWSLLLEKESNQNIGKAKSYGYGRIEVQLTGLRMLDFDQMYRSGQLSLKPYVDVTDRAGDYVKAAKADMTAFLGHDVMSDARIGHFLMMKDTTCIPDNQKTRYMSLDKEYRARVREQVMLPTVEDVVTGKTVYKAERPKGAGNPGKGTKQGNGKDRSNSNKKDYSDKKNYSNKGDYSDHRDDSHGKRYGKSGGSLSYNPFAELKLNNDNP